MNDKEPLEGAGQAPEGAGAREASAPHQPDSRFREMVLQSPFSTMIFDPSGRVLEVNRAFEEMWGVKAADVAGYNPLEDEQSRAQGMIPLLERAFAGETVVMPEAPYDAAQTVTGGRRRWIKTFAYPVRDEAGRLREVVFMHEDVTARREAEEERARRGEEVGGERRRLREIVSTVPGVVWEAWGQPDASAQRIDFISDHVEQMLGYTVEEWLSTPNFWLTIVHPEDKERAARTAAEHFAKGVSGVNRFRWVAKDGRVLDVETHSTVILDEEGRPLGMRGVTLDVTDRKRAEEVLARYGVLSRLSRDIILFVTPDGRIVEANHAAAAAYGYAREELLGKHLSELRAPDSLPLLGEQLRRADERGILFETTHRRRDGSTFPVEVSATGADVAGGRLLLSIVRDITERKRAEQELRRSKQLFEGVAEAIPDVLYLYDVREGRVIYANREVWNVLGYTPEDVEALGGRLFESLMHPEDLPRVPEHLARLAALRDGEVEEFEFRMRRADGGYCWLLSRDVVFTRTAEGRVLLTCGVTQDVSVRRQGLKLIQGQNRVLEMLSAGGHLERVLEEVVRVVEGQSGEMVCSLLLLDEDGQTLRRGAAPSLPASYFEQAEALPSGPFNGAFGPAAGLREQVVVEDIASDPRWAAHAPLALAHGLRACWSTPVLSSTGQVLAAFGVYFRERRGPREEERRLVAAATHLTAVAIERRRAERERELLLESESAARVEAERANRLKDEFLATLSHELRTPLTAILGWSQMLGSGALDASTARRAVEVIRRNAESQKQIVEDVLDASRIVTGKLRIEPGEVDLLAVVGEALDSVRPAAAAKSIELVCDFDPQVGKIVGDPHRLRQVVWNLLSNAVKFTGHGGFVKVDAGRSLSSVRLTVSDTGCGIEPDFLPHVFERFRQADGSTTRQHGGLGLGLSIVRHLVEAHGGSVYAYSAGQGQGASFTVELPLPAGARPPARSDAGEAQTTVRAVTETTPPVGETAPALLGVKVLLIDDDTDTLELLKVFLKGHGAEVSAVTSAKAALEVLARTPPDVIVSDIGMPVVDGYQLMRRVRALPPEAGGNTPAVALTAYATDADRVRAARAGFQTHLSKPVDSAALLAAVMDLAARAGTDA